MINLLKRYPEVVIVLVIFAIFGCGWLYGSAVF